MKRIGAGIAVIVVALTLVSPPAASQNGSALLTASNDQPPESVGELAITISLWRAGRVAYQTLDGSCFVTYSPAGTPPDARCSGPGRAPDDYTATSGELVFTGVGGSKSITVPIVDDDLAEGEEAFTLVAWEEANADPWIDRGDSVVIHIVDDDLNGGGAVATTATTAAGNQSSSSAPVLTMPDSPLGDLPVPDLAVELESPILQPGPGFELTGEDSVQAAAARGSESGGSGSPWLVPGIGTAAAGVGAVAFVRRRKQWSPTRP